MKKINFNSIVKVKLTDFGKDIYYHKDDELILRGLKILHQKCQKKMQEDIQVLHCMNL